MNRQAILTAVATASHKKVVPEIRAGQTVRVSQKIKEGSKERVQNFEGLVIATHGGRGINGTFTVRKIVSGIGVEKVFPLHGATITKVEVKKQAKIRRAKLYYTRNLRGKAARMKETHLQDVVFDEEAAVKAEQEQERAVEEAAKKVADEAKAKEEAAAQTDEAPAEKDSTETQVEAPAKAEAKPEEPEAKSEGKPAEKDSTETQVEAPAKEEPVKEEAKTEEEKK